MVNNQTMIDLLNSFIPRIQHADGLVRYLRSGDVAAVVDCATTLQQRWFSPPTAWDRLRYRHDRFVGPVTQQYIVIEELLAAIDGQLLAIARGQLSDVADLHLAPSMRGLRLVEDSTVA